MGLQLSKENMNLNAVQFNNAILRAARRSPFPGDEKELQPLLDPTGTAAAGGSQQSQGRLGKKPL